MALSGYVYLYEDGVITHDEFEALREDALEDELSDTGGCAPVSGAAGPPTGTHEQG